MTNIIVKIVSWVIGLIAGLTNGFFGSGNILEYVQVLNNTLGAVFEVFDAINFIIPVNVIFGCLLVIVSLRIVAILYNFVEFIILRVFDVIP